MTNYLRLQSGVRSILLTAIMILSTGYLFAQSTTISGTVSDPDGSPLIGATILVKGSTRGALTDTDGKFSIETKEGDSYLFISYIGFANKEVELTGASSYEIILSGDLSMEEVVVTALGVQRDEKALGYAVQKVDAEEVASVKPTNLTNALAGKVAGVYINGSSNGPTASANVTIRGQTSLTGSSQALFVVNGLPVTNGLFSPGDGLNGSTTIDFGNSAQLINPDDVESISVLKGPAAAALYGSRAANGVILVTTKTGQNAKGWGVEINSTTTLQSILKLPDYQNEYGVGGYGFYSYNGGETYTASNGVRYYDAFGENWGPRLDGTPIIQFNSDGQPTPFVPAENNIRDFFRTGVNTINNISLSNASPTGDFRLSYTNLTSRGIVPNTNLERNTIFTSVGKRLFDNKLDLRLNAMYVRNGSDNVPNAGYDETSSVMYGWLWYPRQVPINDLKDYWKPGLENIQQRYVEELWVNNPWFVANENTNAFQENRLIANAAMTYNFTDFLNVRFRFGADVKDEQRQFRRAASTKGILFGSYREDELSFSETNAELLVSYNTPRDKRLVVDLKAGGNIMRQQSNILSANNPQLLQPGVFTLTNNRSGVLVDNPQAEKGINSVFGLASIAFDGFLYLDATGRNDWSSTLPVENNNYFYPSVSLSAVLSEKLNLNPEGGLSFVKLRAAYAEVGSDTDPYLLNNFFEPQPLFGSSPAFSVSSFAVNPDLRPERTTAFEVGADVRFLGNRIRLDATYYDMLSKDQIIFLPVATTTGKQTRLANGGEISNKGVELSLSALIINRDKFQWDVTVNAGHNRAVVETLPAGIEGSYPIIPDVYPGDEGSQNMELVAIEGELLGQIWGLGFQRDASGQIVHQDGFPLLTEDKVSAGSYQPDLRFGIYNTFGFGDFTFGFLFDGQIGGNIYSRTHALMATGGTITNEDDPNLNLSTLEGRSDYDITYDGNNNPVYSGQPGAGVIGPGVDIDGSPNTTAVATRDYFYAYYGNGFNRDNVEAATYDATWVKLREIRLSYQLPSALMEKLGFQKASVSLIGRNLLLFTDVPSIDPETYSIRNGLFVNGYESTQLPSTRSYGVALHLSL